MCACLGQCFVVADMLSQFTRLYSGEVLISMQKGQHHLAALENLLSATRQKRLLVVDTELDNTEKKNCCVPLLYVGSLLGSVLQSNLLLFHQRTKKSPRNISQGQNFKNKMVQYAIQIDFSFFFFNF